MIGDRSIAVPGSVDSVEFGAQDPRGTFASGLLALRRGRLPEGLGGSAHDGGLTSRARDRGHCGP